MSWRNSSVLVVTMLAAFHPAVAAAQGRGWRWFQSCPTPTTMVLEARLDSASIYLADDQGSRDGPSPFWEVAVYDRNWRLLISYGEGQ